MTDNLIPTNGVHIVETHYPKGYSVSRYDAEGFTSDGRWFKTLDKARAYAASLHSKKVIAMPTRRSTCPQCLRLKRRCECTTTDHRLGPFKVGATVRIKGNDHLGLHRITDCEWYVRPSGAGYWLCHAGAVRDPVDLSDYPGQCGIVTGSSWQGSSDHLVHAIR